jgi:hypothetical protein
VTTVSREFTAHRPLDQPERSSRELTVARGSGDTRRTHAAVVGSAHTRTSHAASLRNLRLPKAASRRVLRATANGEEVRRSLLPPHPAKKHTCSPCTRKPPGDIARVQAFARAVHA